MGLSLLRKKAQTAANAMKLLTINQAAEILVLSRWTVSEMIESGSLPAFIVKTGKRKKIWRIREQALQKWIDTREQETRKMVQGSSERKLQAV
jgi:excisionase family DNA binding protein